MKKQLICIMLLGIGLKVYSQQTTDTTGHIQDLGEVVIQGNRLEIPFNESARDIQLITREEILKLPVHSLNELLAYVGGVDIRQRGPFGTQADLSMDGGTAEQTLVLLNGIKLINAQTAHNMMNIPIPLDAIDHIEVLRGAAARVYGINALTGAINIVTLKSYHPSLSVNLYGGSSFKEQAEEDGEGIYGGGGIRLVGNYGDKSQRHLFAASQNLYNGHRYNTAMKNTRLFYNGAYHFDAHNTIQALAGYAYNRFGANGFYAAPGDKNSEEIVETTLFSLSSRHELGEFTLMPRISDRYDEDDYRYYKNDLSKGRSLHYTNALMMELNGNWHTAFGEFGMGWETRITSINSSNIGQHDRDNHGAFAEYRGKFFDKLMTNIGVYVNYNTKFGWKAYPGIDLAYLLDDHWKIAASLGSGQRIPSFTDLYLQQAPGNVGNPELQPENSWQYEANIDFSSGYFQAHAGAFYREVSHFIDWVRPNSNQPYVPHNFGRSEIYGFYARIHKHFQLSDAHALNLHISYNYLKPTLYDYGQTQSKYVLETLKHQLISGIRYTYRQFSVQIENRYLQRALNDPYDVLDARINYRHKNFLFYAKITNLLDTQYKEIAAVPMPSRWFTLGLKFYWKQF